MNSRFITIDDHRCPPQRVSWLWWTTLGVCPIAIFAVGWWLLGVSIPTLLIAEVVFVIGWAVGVEVGTRVPARLTASQKKVAFVSTVTSLALSGLVVVSDSLIGGLAPPPQLLTSEQQVARIRSELEEVRKTLKEEYGKRTRLEEFCERISTERGQALSEAKAVKNDRQLLFERLGVQSTAVALTKISELTEKTTGFESELCRLRKQIEEARRREPGSHPVTGYYKGPGPLAFFQVMHVKPAEGQFKTCLFPGKWKIYEVQEDPGNPLLVFLGSVEVPKETEEPLDLPLPRFRDVEPTERCLQLRKQSRDMLPEASLLPLAQGEDKPRKDPEE